MLYYLEIASLILAANTSETQIMKAKQKAVRHNLGVAEGQLKLMIEAPQNLLNIIDRFNILDFE